MQARCSDNRGKKKTNQVTGGLERADKVGRLYCKEGAFGGHEQAQALGCGDGRIEMSKAIKLYS